MTSAQLPMNNMTEQQWHLARRAQRRFPTATFEAGAWNSVVATTKSVGSFVILEDGSFDTGKSSGRV